MFMTNINDIDPAFKASRIYSDGVIDQLTERSLIDVDEKVLAVGSAAVNAVAFETLTSELQEIRSANVENLTVVSDYVHQLFANLENWGHPERFRVGNTKEAKLLQSFVLWGVWTRKDIDSSQGRPYLMIGKRQVAPTKSGLPDTELLLARREAWTSGDHYGNVGAHNREITFLRAKTWGSELAAIENEQDIRLSLDYTEKDLRALLDRDKLNEGKKELVIEPFTTARYGRLAAIEPGSTLFRRDLPADSKLPKHRERLSMEEKMKTRVEYVRIGLRKDKIATLAGGPLIVDLKKTVTFSRSEYWDEEKANKLNEWKGVWLDGYLLDYTKPPIVIGNQELVSRGNVIKDFNVVDQITRLNNAEKLLRRRFGESQD